MLVVWRRVVLLGANRALVITWTGFVNAHYYTLAFPFEFQSLKSSQWLKAKQICINNDYFAHILDGWNQSYGVGGKLGGFRG